MKDILKYQPNLIYYNKNGISDRLKKLNMFIAYNGFTNRYEIHYVKSFKYDGNSLQDSMIDDELLNQFLVRSIRENDHERFVRELEGERRRLENQVELHEERLMNANTDSIIQGIQRTLGRRF
jgi:hypothetical protein